MKFALEKDYMGEIAISESFFNETMDSLDFSELKVYLKEQRPLHFLTIWMSIRHN